MKTINFEGCKTAQEIEERVKAALEYETIVANDNEAEQWFKDAGYEGDVIHRDVLRKTIWLWDDKMDGEYSVSVAVDAHYVDPGSVDYVYSYSVE